MTGILNYLKFKRLHLTLVWTTCFRNWKIIAVLWFGFLIFKYSIYISFRVDSDIPLYNKDNKDRWCEILTTENNEAIVHKALNYVSLHPRSAILPAAYQLFTQNCSAYLSQRNFIVENITRDEKNFPIAFSIVMYKHVEQVERLLQAIYRPHNVYCVHVDINAPPEVYQAMVGIASCLPNIMLASKRSSVMWGTMSVLEPELTCMSQLMTSKVKWRYFINLTGQEYPLKTNYQIVKILQAFKGANDVQGSATRLNKDRVNVRERAPHGIVPCKGPLHMTVSREFAAYVLYDKVAQDFLVWCRNMSVPDETYFTSLNNNRHLKVPGSYAGDIEDEERQYFSRYKSWQGQQPCGSGKYVRGICMLGIRDLPALASSDRLFANKFLYEFQPLTYDCLERRYQNMVQLENAGYLNFDTSVYEQSTVVRYRYSNDLAKVVTAIGKHE